MKTREVIRLLAEADPTGEVECSVGGIDITYIERLPGFYDGAFQTLTRDKDGDITGAKINRRGDKVVISSMSIADAIFDDMDLPVDVSDDPRRADDVARWRKEAFDIHTRVERAHFVRWATAARGMSAAEAEAYFDAHYRHDTPLPEEFRHGAGISWSDRRELQWTSEVPSASSKE